MRWRPMGNGNRSRKHRRVDRPAVAPPVVPDQLFIFLRTQPRFSLKSAKRDCLLLSSIRHASHIERKFGSSLLFSHLLDKLRFTMHFLGKRSGIVKGYATGKFNGG